MWLYLKNKFKKLDISVINKTKNSSVQIKSQSCEQQIKTWSNVINKSTSCFTEVAPIKMQNHSSKKI